MQREPIAIIGLGELGGKLARRLLQAGYALVVLDRDRKKARALESLGPVATVVDLAQLQERASVLLSCLPSEKAVEEIALALDRSGLVFFDLSLIRPSTARRLNGVLKARGIAYVEGPLVRRETKSDAFVQLLSGEPGTIERIRTLAGRLAERVYVVGPVGAASRLALAASVLRLLHLIAAAEVMTVVAADGGEIQTMCALAQELGASPAELAHWQRLCLVADEPCTPLRIAAKDAALMRALAEELGLDLPLLRRADELFRAALAEGFAERDAAAVICALERETGVRLGSARAGR